MQMTLQADALQSCLQKTAKAARFLIERCVDDAVAALQAAETQTMRVADRDELGRAWRELLKYKPAWSAQYPLDLLASFKANVVVAAQIAGAPAEAFAPAQSSGFMGLSTGADLSHTALSLVADAEVSQAIESSRLLQQVLPSVEHILAELNTLISTLQGFPNVRPELNPLRPEVFSERLRKLVFKAAVEPAIASLWIRYLAPPLGRELKRLFEGVVRQLERDNVRGASYRVLPTPDSAPRNRTQGGDDEGAASGFEHWDRDTAHSQSADLSGEPAARPPSQYADLSDRAIRDELFQAFLLQGGNNTHHGLTTSYYETVDKELLALDEPDATPFATSQLLVEERGELNSQIWGRYAHFRERAVMRTQLEKEALRVSQVLGLEVVRKLVSQVAQDPRLLVPMRQAIVALEPSLLRLAMVDPRFFSDEGHAGRRLMERVAQRSFKYNDAFSPEFQAFFEPVTRAVNALNGQAIHNTQRFDSALAALEFNWDRQDQHEVENRNSVLQVLRFAEERQTQADQIALTLSARSDLKKVPGLVLDFLFDTWALAMAHARLIDTRNQIDPMGFGSVVPDLIWSVKQDVTLKQPAKLIKMIPGLLGQLHAGLELLGQEPHTSEAFFEGLMDLHRPVLKLRRVKSRRDAQESGAMPLAPEQLAATLEQRRAKAAASPWLRRNDLEAAGFEDTLRTVSGENATGPVIEPPGGPAETPTNSPDLAFGASSPAIAQTEAEQILRNLQAGDWVDLYSRRHWLRAQLIWASDKGLLFMFVSHGGQPHSMTKRSGERLIQAHLLRPMVSYGVVAQALGKLVKGALSLPP
jgi:hypothetical protein